MGLTLAAYWPSFNASFQWDDIGSVVENNYIKIKDFSLPSILNAAFQDRRQNRPLANLSLAVNYYFNQLDPFGYHLVNFFGLVITALGIWLLLRKLFLRVGYDPFRAGLAAWLVSLIWAVHPVNIQAVTYIVQREASFAGAFSIWSIYFFHLGMERKGKGFFLFILSGLFCVFALLCKETAATLPAMILAYKVYFWDELRPGWLKLNFKWIVALAIICLTAGSIMLRPSMIKLLLESYPAIEFSQWQRSLTELNILIWYLFIIIFPFPQFLSIVHRFPISTSIIEPPYTIFAFLAILIVIVIALWQARNWRLFSFAVLWYLGQLLVEALPLPVDPLNEYRLYLASLAIIVPAVAGPVLKNKKLPLVVCWVMIIACFFAGFTWHRNQVWLTKDSLLKDAVSKSPGSLRAWFLYCEALGKAQKCRSVEYPCALGAEAMPNYYLPHQIVGECYLKAGKLENAERALLKAYELNLSDKSTCNDLALLYNLRKDYERAAKFYQIIIIVDPSDAQAHFNLASDYKNLGKEEDEIRELKETLKLAPDWKRARRELASALVKKGNCSEAVDLIKSAPAYDRNFEQILSPCRQR